MGTTSDKPGPDTENKKAMSALAMLQAQCDELGIELTVDGQRELLKKHGSSGSGRSACTSRTPRGPRTTAGAGSSKLKKKARSRKSKVKVAGRIVREQLPHDDNASEERKEMEVKQDQDKVKVRGVSARSSVSSASSSGKGSSNVHSYGRRQSNLKGLKHLYMKGANTKTSAGGHARTSGMSKAGVAATAGAPTAAALGTKHDAAVALVLKEESRREREARRR